MRSAGKRLRGRPGDTGPASRGELRARAVARSPLVRHNRLLQPAYLQTAPDDSFCAALHHIPRAARIDHEPLEPACSCGGRARRTYSRRRRSGGARRLGRASRRRSLRRSRADAGTGRSAQPSCSKAASGITRMSGSIHDAVLTAGFGQALTDIDAVVERLRAARGASCPIPTRRSSRGAWTRFSSAAARVVVADLDRISRHRPIAVIHANFHVLNVNSAMLARAGITRDIDVDGIVRDAGGQSRLANWPRWRRCSRCSG